MGVQVQVNGESADLTPGTSISELLSLWEVKIPDMVSVRLNDEAIARDRFDTTVVESGDAVEFLYFMGGGAAGPVDRFPADRIEHTSENDT